MDVSARLRGMRATGLLVLLLLSVSCGDDVLGVREAPVLSRYATAGNGTFVDADGREVLLRGVNVVSLGEYWRYDDDISPVFPFTDADMDLLASMGFNLVRLVISWSRIEPAPGEYDAAYLEEIGAVVDALHERGIYTLLDMHQDAWGPSLAARPDETCGVGTTPAAGWDGAPAWATIVDDATARCAPVFDGFAVRELSPAVVEAWMNFVADVEGPGGVGVQQRFHDMWTHVAHRLGGRPGVMGYDLINEPNIFTSVGLFGPLYARGVDAIRRGERRAGIDPRVIVVEPASTWALVPSGAAPLHFSDDPQLAYGPHVYQEAISPIPLDQAQVQRARDDAQELGGVPILVGEWGADPALAATDNNYFDRMISLQDAERWAATFWTYQSACGDPHGAFAISEGHSIDDLWGFRDLMCDVANEPLELRQPLVDTLTRPALHWAPGAITSLDWDPAARVFTAAGDAAASDVTAVLRVPPLYDDLTVSFTGVSDVVETTPSFGGRHFEGRADGGAWTVRVAP